MELLFEPLQLPKDRGELIRFLSADEWPYHVHRQLSEAKVHEMLETGEFTGRNHECFWISQLPARKIGLLRLFDLHDIADGGYPLFDLRMRSFCRGKGIGRLAVQWLTSYLFEKYQSLERIVGTTRADNLPMRKIFRHCGFVKEGHFRRAWADQEGRNFDTVRYSILRDDWRSGRTTPVIWNDEL